MIQETAISQAIEDLNHTPDLQLLEFVEKQRSISNYLLGDSFNLFTEYEKELLLFIHLVIWKALVAPLKTVHFSIDEYLLLEEQTWEQISSKSLSWESKKNLLFDEFPEVDLLAFVEDVVADDEITDTVREILFVTARTYILYHIPN